MANAEQLALLKAGVEGWNQWRKKNRLTEIDLSQADLREAKLSGVDLSGVVLRGVNLSMANLSEANLRYAKLTKALLIMTNLSQSDLSRAVLIESNLGGADLPGADLSGAILYHSDLSRANFDGASLSKANLRGTDLRGANLQWANFSGAKLQGSQCSGAALGFTLLTTVDLSEAIGLEDVSHFAPSQISTDTFVLSKGKIPDSFLRGCGLSDWEIEAVKLYNADLSNEERNRVLYKIYDLQASQAVQISPLFISYSHADSEFVDRLGQTLQDKGVRYWRDIHEMKAGRMEPQVDRAIRQNPTVLLVLSKHSLSSDWVQHEVRTARAFEKDIGRDVLCPVALDDSWKSSSRWPKRVMEQIMEYNILDFSAWQDDGKFDGMFRRLIDGLKLFYKG